MKLEIGNRYHYWNRSVYERKPSRKECELLSISRDRKYARVRRLDLDINDVQHIEVKRLRLIVKKLIDKQLNLKL